MLFVRHHQVTSSVVAAAFATTLSVGAAMAQSANAATPEPMLPLGTSEGTSSTAQAEPSRDVDSSADAAIDPFSQAVMAKPGKDEVVLKPPASTRWMLLGAGLAVTGAFYGASYGSSTAWPHAPGESKLKYPIAGPFMDLAKTGCPKNQPGCSTFELVVRTVLVGLDAIGQVGGIGLFLEGALFSPSGIDAPRVGQYRPSKRQVESLSMIPIPWTDGQSSAGLGIVGRF